MRNLETGTRVLVAAGLAELREEMIVPPGCRIRLT
jgi:hypothetical protein